MDHFQNNQLKDDWPYNPAQFLHILTKTESSSPNQTITGQNLQSLLEYLKNVYEKTSYNIQEAWSKKDPEIEPQFVRDIRNDYLQSMTREFNWLIETWEKCFEIDVVDIVTLYSQLIKIDERYRPVKLFDGDVKHQEPNWWERDVEHIRRHVEIGSEQFDSVRLPKTCRIFLPCGHDDYFTGVEIGLGDLDNPIVVKHIKPGVLSELRQIAASLRRVSHKNLLPFFVTPGPDSMIVMPLMRMNLGQYVMHLNLTHRLVNESQEIIHQIIKGLFYLHKSNHPPIIHGNLKPTNVLLDENSKIRLADFGMDYKSKPTGISLIWKSVEQVRAYKNGEPCRASLCSDVSSAGMLTYFVLTAGQHPFGATIPEILANLVEGSFELNLSDPVIRHLLTNMLMTDEVNRPDVSEVTRHIFWWPVGKRWWFVEKVVLEEREGPDSGIFDFLAEAAEDRRHDQAILFAKGGAKNTQRDIHQFLLLMEQGAMLTEIRQKIPNLPLHLYQILKPTCWAHTTFLKPFFDARFF